MKHRASMPAVLVCAGKHNFETSLLHQNSAIFFLPTCDADAVISRKTNAMHICFEHCLVFVAREMRSLVSVANEPTAIDLTKAPLL